MPKVFISHSTDDRALIDSKIVPALQSAGLKTWYSKDDIHASEQWERSILKGLESCEWFLVAMSPSSARSPWVRSEVSWAVGRRWMRIVPVMIKDCDPIDFHLHLPQIHYVDFRDPGPESDRALAMAFNNTAPESPSPTPASEPPTLSPTPQQIDAPKSHFHCGPWVPAEYFIGREEELTEARHLIDARQSFLIVGHPRAGKTSFCHKLKKEYESQEDSEMLISYLNLQQCSELTIETFLEHTILNVVGEIARKVFGCRFMDLRKPSPADGYPHLRHDPIFASFVEISRHVNERTHNQDGTQPLPLVPHEFVHLAKDLLEIAEEKGRRGFLILYDEANRLPVDISGNLFLSIGETLNETGVTGGYVASPEMEDRFQELDQLFGARLVVGPFETMQEMRQLLARYYLNDAAAVDSVPASDGALETLWERSRGAPFLIQLIADRSFRVARRQGSRTVNAEHVEQGYQDAIHDRPTAFRKV